MTKSIIKHVEKIRQIDQFVSFIQEIRLNLQNKFIIF